MYQGKPMLKKVKHINHNNPTLNSYNMRGVFYQPTPPTIIRDELLYNSRFKDSLQQTVEQEDLKRYQQSSTPNSVQLGAPVGTPIERESQQLTSNYEPLWLRNQSKNQVLDKVTHLPQEMSPENFNYQGYRTIKNKQLHGFNIINNF